MSRFRVLCCVSAVFCCFWSSLWGVQTQPVDTGLFHEAYVTKVNDIPLLTPVTEKPPIALEEAIPVQADKEQRWIPGYWAWLDQDDIFVWVPGFWRRPPPGQVWTPGRWLNSNGGWVWLSGFWSKVAGAQLKYRASPPPGVLNEQVPAAPDPDHFWVRGYWSYNDQKGDYAWKPGYWETFDPKWVLVPSYYVWRPEGYALIEPYWDWPLEYRGSPYAPIAFDNWKNIGRFSPSEPLDLVVVLNQCYLYYPDYNYMCGHHFHYHPDYWTNYDIPSWWYWNQWWTLGYYDNWALWWWYTHPGYPQPKWLTKEYADKIAPPSKSLLKKIKLVKDPAIVTQNGVVTKQDLLKVNSSLKGDKSGKIQPIITDDLAVSKKVQDSLKLKNAVPATILEPQGTADARNEQAPILKIGSFGDQSKGVQKSPSITLPRPNLPSQAIPSVKMPNTGNLEVTGRSPIKLRPRLADLDTDQQDTEPPGGQTGQPAVAPDPNEKPIPPGQRTDRINPPSPVDQPGRGNQPNRQEPVKSGSPRKPPFKGTKIDKMDQLNRTIIRDRSGYDFPTLPTLDSNRPQPASVQKMYDTDAAQRRERAQQDAWRAEQERKRKEDEDRRKREEDQRLYFVH
jgi:hypothetical protein